MRRVALLIISTHLLFGMGSDNIRGDEQFDRVDGDSKLREGRSSVWREGRIIRGYNQKQQKPGLRRRRIPYSKALRL